MKNQTHIKNNKLIVGAGTMAICATLLAVGLAAKESNHVSQTGKLAAKSDPEAQSPAWLVDYEAAKAQALKEDKALLLNFTGSDWCPWCIKLDREVFAKKEFKEYARKHLVLVRVDFPKRHELPAGQQVQNEQLAARFGIEGFPTVLVLNPKEKVLGVLGYSRGGVGEFVSQLTDALANGRAGAQ